MPFTVQARYYRINREIPTGRTHVATIRTQMTFTIKTRPNILSKLKIRKTVQTWKKFFFIFNIIFLALI